MEEYAEQGDVVLQLSDRQLLVWSGALRLASPVFAAMFDGRFAEGQSLSAASPRVIPLPHDDANSMAIFCKITHMKTVDLSMTSSADLVKLAVLADKYDCVHVLRPWGKMWISALMPDDISHGLETLLVAAYGLDLPEEFSKITQSMIRDSSEPLSVVAVVQYCDILPMHVIDQISKAQHDAQRRALAAFDTVYTGKEVCNEALEHVSKSLKTLWVDCLWSFGSPSVLHL